jgi:hypothetical protein
MAKGKSDRVERIEQQVKQIQENTQQIEKNIGKKA